MGTGKGSARTARPNARVRQSEVPAAQATFLEALAECGTITHAARLAGVGRRTVYDWLEADPAFAAAFEVAREESVDELVREARRRALEGEPVRRYNRDGELVSETRQYSDTLLLALLKAGRPTEFSDKREVQVAGSLAHDHSGRVQVDVLAAIQEYAEVLDDPELQGGSAAGNGVAEPVATP